MYKKTNSRMFFIDSKLDLIHDLMNMTKKHIYRKQKEDLNESLDMQVIDKSIFLYLKTLADNIDKGSTNKNFFAVKSAIFTAKRGLSDYPSEKRFYEVIIKQLTSLKNSLSK